MSDYTDYREDEKVEENDEPVETLPYQPETQAETVRKTGLAYSAGLMLGVSIIIFLLIGLALDRYFQMAPLFIVICTLLGAVIGFYNFFRITSRINKPVK